MSQERVPSPNSWSEGSPPPQDQGVQPSVQNSSEPTEKNASEPKRVKLFFSALDYNLSQKELEDMIKPYAENVVVDMKHGFAFVELDGNGENVINKLDGQKQEKGGRQIHVQIAEENFRRRKKQDMLAKITDRMKDTLFVVGFDSQTIDRTEFVALFEKFGPIKKHQFPRNFCFVQYEKDEDAEKAQAAMNGTEYKERKLVVEFSTTDAFNRDQPAPYGFYRGSDRGRSFGRGRGGFESYGRPSSSHYGIDPSMIDPKIRDEYMKQYGSDRDEYHSGAHLRSRSHDHAHGYEREHDHDRDRSGGYSSSSRYSSSSSSSHQFPPYNPSSYPFSGSQFGMDNAANMLYNRRIQNIQSQLQHHEITAEEYQRLGEFYYNQQMQMQYSKYNPSSQPPQSTPSFHDTNIDHIRPPYNANRGFDFIRSSGGWDNSRQRGGWDMNRSRNWDQDQKWKDDNVIKNSNWEKRDDRIKNRELEHSPRHSPRQSRDNPSSTTTTTITDRKDGKDKEIKVEIRGSKLDDNWNRDQKRVNDLQIRSKGNEKDGERGFQTREVDSKTRIDGQQQQSSYQQQSQSSRIKPNSINQKSDRGRGRSWSRNSSNSRSGSASPSVKKGSKWGQIRSRSRNHSSSDEDNRSRSRSSNGHDHNHDHDHEQRPSSRRTGNLKQAKSVRRDGMLSRDASGNKGKKIRDSSHSESRSESRSSIESSRQRSKSNKKDKNGSKKREKK